MRGFGRLALRIWLCAAIAQTLVIVALFAALINIHTRQGVDLLETLVGRVVATAEARTALGYQIETQTPLQGLIESLSVSAKRTAEIYIVDADNVITFSTDGESIGSTMDAAWQHTDTGSADYWTVLTDREIVVGRSLVTPLGTLAGAVVARSLRRDVLVDVVSATQRPVLIGFAALALLAVLVVPAAGLALHPLRLRFGRMARLHAATAELVTAGEVPNKSASPSDLAVTAVIVEMERLEAQAAKVDRVEGAAGATARPPDPPDSADPAPAGEADPADPAAPGGPV